MGTIGFDRAKERVARLSQLPDLGQCGTQIVPSARVLRLAFPRGELRLIRSERGTLRPTTSSIGPTSRTIARQLTKREGEQSIDALNERSRKCRLNESSRSRRSIRRQKEVAAS